jgi:CheY-like chemotaxis protein
MASVLIFDDDPQVGALVAEIVRGRGLTVEHHLSAAGIVGIVRDAKPRLIVLDVMMPGLDGLSACHAIRADPSTRHVRIVMLTSKTSAVDQETAKRYGADLYLTKPFSVAALTMAVSSLFGETVPAEAPAAPAAPITMTVLPGGAVIENGDRWIVLDAGEGVGAWMESQRTAPREAWIFLSRYADAAVAELDKIGLLLAVGASVRLAGPDSPDTPLNHLAPRMVRGMRPGKRLPMVHPLREGEISLFPGVFATAFHSLHPGLTMGYRFDFPNRRIVYAPAHIPSPDPAQVDGHDARKFRAFFADADLMLHGFERSVQEPGEGAAWEAVQDHAAYAGVKRLMLVASPGTAVEADLGARAATRAEMLKLDCRLSAGHPRIIF